MNKKGILITVVCVLVLAVGGGAAVLKNVFSSDKNTAPTEYATDGVLSETHIPEDAFVEGTEVVLTDGTDIKTQETVSESEFQENFSNIKYSGKEFTVDRVVDHTTGEQINPRVVFGNGYKECHLKFTSDSELELYLDTVSGTVKHGKYEIYEYELFVTYDEGASTEYNIILDNSGNLQYIIVNYGDYDVYFV